MLGRTVSLFIKFLDRCFLQENYVTNKILVMQLVNNEHFSESAVEHFSQTISSFVRQKANKYIRQTIGEDISQLTDEVAHKLTDDLFHQSIRIVIILFTGLYNILAKV